AVAAGAGVYYVASSSAPVSIVEAGWARMIDDDVAHNSDEFEIDPDSGELTPAAVRRLKPGGEDSPTLDALRTQAEGEFCEFVLDTDGNIRESKVTHLLFNTLIVVRQLGPEPSDE